MPARVNLPSGHLRRVAELLASHGEDKAAAWLLGVLEAQECPSQAVRDRINSMRPEWEQFSTFDAEEEHNFRVNESDFKRLCAAEWDLIRDFLSYRPREGESFFQVEKRLWFLKAPEDTLTAARKWSWTHRGRPRFIEKPDPLTHQDSSVKDLLSEVFKDAAWKD
jgi:hypothetical protein